MPTALCHRWSTCLLAMVAALGAASCSNDARQARTIELADCRLPKLATAAKCGTVEVPEDRDKPDGRRIKLFVALLPANTLSPKPDPLVVLAGGPGQAATALAPFASRLVEVRRTRDVLLVDQRGTGRSAPLKCAAFGPEDDPAESLEADPLPRATKCAQELAAQGIDVAQYTTRAWVEDLEAIRNALGYPRWNLWGGSYGTRVALEYLRRYGDRVRSLVLDGAAPPSLKISFGVWQTREQAMEALFAACEATASCRTAHPDLRSLLKQILAELSPDGQNVSLVDPRTGAVQTLRLTPSILLAWLHPMTYMPELAVTMPEMLQRGAQGDWAPLYAVSQMVLADIVDVMNAALHYAVTCAEDAPRVQPQDRTALDGLHSAQLAAKVLAICDIWPRGVQPADATQAVESKVPTLLLSGALDPVTPPAYAEEVAKSLPNSKHVVAGGYGHIVSPHACGPRLIAAFVDRAGFDKLPRSCVDYFTESTRPPLWPDHLAPAQ